MDRKLLYSSTVEGPPDCIDEEVVKENVGGERHCHRVDSSNKEEARPHGRCEEGHDFEGCDNVVENPRPCNSAAHKNVHAYDKDEFCDAFF